MTLDLSKTLFTFAASVLLVAACVTSSDARPHAKRLSPTQGAVYYHSDSDTSRDRDSSCFHSVPAMYGCSANGG